MGFIYFAELETSNRFRQTAEKKQFGQQIILFLLDDGELNQIGRYIVVMAPCTDYYSGTTANVRRHGRTYTQP